MPVVSFDLESVLKLVEVAQQATEFSPSGCEMFDPQLYPNGVVVDVNGLTREEAEKAGTYFWPDESKLDKTKIEPTLQIIIERGVQISTNALSANSDIPLFANGYNPTKDEFAYEMTRDNFGGDSQSIPIPLNWAVIAKEQGSTHFNVIINRTSVSLSK